MSSFDFWKMCWEEKWATESDMKQAVVIGELVEEEYEEIVGVAYTS
ncbi:XkdX-like protein [Tumebacillus sp. BK434]|nr:XkdX family protein [Tumebacillus sp. BK434]TCP57787.1 XkdX-like protein [Tumebacillus sp. BK434]